jgi:hypothetical protein
MAEEGKKDKMTIYEDILNDMLKGIKRIREEMNEKGLITNKTGFKDIADYAGKHIIVTSKNEEKK